MLRLKEMRESAGLSQSDVAKALGRDKKSVGNWENGRVDIKLTDFMALCDLYKCTPDELAGWESPARSDPALTAPERALLADYRASDSATRVSISIIAANSAAAAKRERTRQQRPPGGASGSCDAETA